MDIVLLFLVVIGSFLFYKRKVKKEALIRKFKNGESPAIVIYALFAFGLLLLLLPYILSHHSLIGIDATAGTIGDAVNGITAPFMTFAAIIVTFYAFWIQYQANEQQKIYLAEQAKVSYKERFESVFFEMIKLHRDNVSDMKYSKFYIDKLTTAENRKVFRVIFQEFIECYREVKKFSNSNIVTDYIKPKHARNLKQIMQPVNPSINLIELAIIDIAYCIVFFGVGKEGEVILKNRFEKKYNSTYYLRILTYLQLKPKGENQIRFRLWTKLRNSSLERLRTLVEEIYKNRANANFMLDTSEEARDFLFERNYDKYYGGHQHRLGHYFRHLYQSYTYLNNDRVLTRQEKYFYGKTLRAQLSTYEQALIFINSISSLGMRWEYVPDIKDVKDQDKQEAIQDRRLITKYAIIKNLPGWHFFGIKYQRYYPQVQYEAAEPQLEY